MQKKRFFLIMYILDGVKSNLLDRQNAPLLQKSLWCLVVRSYLGRHAKWQCDTALSFVLRADCCWRVCENDFRSLIKHYFLRGKTAKETKEKLDKYYVANTPSDYTVKYWFREFRGGRNSTTDEVRSGRPSDAVTEENVKKIHEMVLADRKVKVRELADATKISTERTRHILGEILHKKKIFFIPKEVTFHPT